MLCAHRHGQDVPVSGCCNANEHFKAPSWCLEMALRRRCTNIRCTSRRPAGQEQGHWGGARRTQRATGAVATADVAVGWIASLCIFKHGSLFHSIHARPFGLGSSPGVRLTGRCVHRRSKRVSVRTHIHSHVTYTSVLTPKHAGPFPWCLHGLSVHP